MSQIEKMNGKVSGKKLKVLAVNYNISTEILKMYDLIIRGNKMWMRS